MYTIFVTVGSTRFDKLLESVLSSEFLCEIKKHGFTKLIIQAGGSNIPDHNTAKGLNVEIYTYKKDISQDARKANLVISHAGAGTCLEMLRLNKKLLIVVNDSLMDNHQIELAEQLEEDGYAAMASVNTIREKFVSIQEQGLSFRKFPQPTRKFEEIIEAKMEKLIH